MSLSLKKTFQYLWWFLALVWEVFVPFCLGRTWNSPPFPLIINSTSPHSHSNGYVGHTSPGHEWNGNPGLSRPAYSITQPHHIISLGLGTWPNPDQRLLGLCVLWNWQEKNRNMLYSFRPVILNQGQFCPHPPGTLGNVWSHFWLLLLEGERCYWQLSQLVEAREAAELPMMQTGRSPSQRIFWPKTSVVLRLKNLVSGLKSSETISLEL